MHGPFDLDLQFLQVDRLGQVVQGPGLHGVDSGISPGTTIGVQDSGFFEFQSDVTGTYAVFIDIDQNGEFGNAGDVLLLGNTVVGLNSVPWDGRDATGQRMASGELLKVHCRIRTERIWHPGCR